MALSFAIDDNHAPLHAETGLRPDFAHIARATTGAAVAELSLSTVNVAANRNAAGGICILRVTVVGSNACYFSLGAAATAPGSNATMISLPANSTHFFKATAADASAYHLQNTGASEITVNAMV